MLLTSKDIPQTPITEFSNGNCELVIAEMPTINTVGIVFYRPSRINFSIKKYNEAMMKIQDYLKTE